EAEFLRDFRVMRFQAVLEPYRLYKEILAASLEHAMRLHGLPYRREDGAALVAAVPTFGPFPEVPAVLAEIKRKYPIAIISNTDDDSHPRKRRTARSRFRLRHHGRAGPGLQAVARRV